MTSEIGSLALATIAYRVATESDCLPDLCQQVKDGVYTEEEAAALVLLLDQNASDSTATLGDSSGPGPQVGWIG